MNHVQVSVKILPALKSQIFFLKTFLKIKCMTYRTCVILSEHGTPGGGTGSLMDTESLDFLPLPDNNLDRPFFSFSFFSFCKA